MTVETRSELVFHRDTQSYVMINVEPTSDGRVRLGWLAAGDLGRRKFLQILRALGCSDGDITLYNGKEVKLVNLEAQVDDSYQTGEIICWHGDIGFLWGACGPQDMGHFTTIGIEVGPDELLPSPFEDYYGATAGNCSGAILPSARLQLQEAIARLIM